MVGGILASLAAGGEGAAPLREGMSFLEESRALDKQWGVFPGAGRVGVGGEIVIETVNLKRTMAHSEALACS